MGALGVIVALVGIVLNNYTIYGFLQFGRNHYVFGERKKTTTLLFATQAVGAVLILIGFLCIINSP